MKRRLFLCLPAIVLFAACKPDDLSNKNDESGKLRVLATFLPVHAHAASIAGDLAIVESIVSGDVGAHGFSPRPADMERIAKADVLVLNGAGMEPWLDDLVRHSAKKDLKKVDLSIGVELMANPPVFGASDSSSGEPNPHLWLDPVIAIRQVETLRDALVAADPQGAGTYQKNAADYIAKLRELDADFQRVLGPLPSKKLVTFHDAFPYLAKRYGLESIGYIAEFPRDTITAFTFTGSVALGVILISLLGKHRMLEGLLFGSIYANGPADIAHQAILAAIVLVFFLTQLRPLTLATLDPELARSRGLRPALLHYAFSLLVAATVAVGLKMLGAILLSALIVMPAAAARIASTGFRSLIAGALLLGCLAPPLGIAASATLNLPTGPCIVLVHVAALAICQIIHLLRSQQRTAA